MRPHLAVLEKDWVDGDQTAFGNTGVDWLGRRRTIIKLHVISLPVKLR
jgi:hypothetical protein